MKLLLLAAALAATAVSARPSPALVRQMHSPAQAKYPHYERVQPRFVHHDEEGYGRSHMWVDEGAAKALAPVASQHTMMGYWWNFAHPNATKDDAAHKACDCKPGYHFALDVKCHVDAFGHLRVTHPEMACSGEQYRADKHRWHYKAPNSPHSGKGPYGNEAGKPDRCLRRHWTGTHGVTHHRCAFLTKTTCACCDCKDGKHHLCPAGKHRHVISGSCLDCAKGRFTDKPNDLARCEDCPGGRFTAQLATVTCKQCERGQYQPDVEQTECKDCARGRYTPNRGRLGCDDCDRGQHQLFLGKDHCNKCTAGHYAPQPGTVGCAACPAETWQPDEGKDHCNAAEVCDADEYETKDYTATSDRTCGTHTTCNSKRQYITKPAGTHHDRECGRCPPGYWCNGSSKTKCAKGKFQTGQPEEQFPDLSFCPLCAKGTYAGGTGWLECKNCPKGFFQRDEGHPGCKQCFAGTHADVPGLVECKSCKKGKFASGRGLVTCSKCDKGQYQGTEGASACLDCVAGQIAATKGLKQCADCGTELWQDLDGQAECKDTTKCAADEYETDDYTTSTNRVCRAHHTCDFPAALHQAGEYVTKRPGTHHDRECASLNECDYTAEPGQYESTLAGTHRQRQCTGVIRCGKGQYMSRDKTYTSQRECSACSGDTTQLSASHIATVCPARATCGRGERVLSHGSTSVQRTCTACSGDTYRADASHVEDACLDRRECQAGTRMSHDGSFTKDRTCVACQGDTWRDESDHRHTACKPRTLCQPGQYMTDNGSFTNDRTCANCPGDTYQDAADHTLTSCKARALCGKGEYTDNTGGTEDTGGWRRANNRVCKPCSGDTFQARVGHTQRACDDRRECTKAQRMAHDGSFIKDRSCVTCQGDTFKAKVSHRDTACEARKLCQRGQRMSHDGSHELDRTCVSCGHPAATDTFQTRSNHKRAACDARSKCGPGYYMDFDGSYVADRTCVSCAGDTFKTETKHTHTACDARTTCDWDNEWMEHDGHFSKDRVCTALTVCTGHEYETKPKTRTSDRTCATIDKCDWPRQWESKAPTYSSDRECTIVRKCTTTQWQRHAPTPTSNRVCMPHTRCHNKAFGQAEDREWQSKPDGTHHDRECKGITTCTSTQWQSAQYTTTSDRQCEDCSAEPACPWNQYRWTLHEQQQGLTRPGLSTDQICGGVSPGVCVYDCHDRFPWATTNCFVGRSGTPWFSATTQWSQHAFPEWPEHASTRVAVDLERHARGAAKGVTVHRGGKIVIKKNGGELQIGLTTCHAHEWEHTSPTPSDDRVCEHAGVCANGELIKLGDRRQRHHCGSCDAGYHLVGRACIAWGGLCANGHMPDQADRVQENQCATCKPGYGFNAATRTCSQCTAGSNFSGTTDAQPCSPVDAGLTCAAGHGFIQATATTDHKCEACDGVFTYSDVNDRSACKSIDRVLTCVAGQGFVTATTRRDAACVPCNGTTKFSATTDQRPCENVNTGRTCPSGQGFVPSTPSTDTLCAACDGTSQYNSATDQTPCRDVNDSLTCPPGQGFVPATAHEDHSCVPCDGTKTFSDSTDGTSCQAVNSALTCGPGYGFVPATPSSDSACRACVLKVTFSGATDNSPCSAANTARACAAGLGFVASTLTKDSKCVRCDGTTMYSDDTDNSACKPVHVTRTCPIGEGLVAATPSTDTDCAVCDGVATFSDTTDGSACKHIDNQRACGLGQGFLPGSSATDSLCEACDGVTRFSDDTDNSPCKAVNTGRVCAVGQGLVDSNASSDTSCVACDGITTFSAASENVPCSPINAARTCGPGFGFVAATASADTHCRACTLGAEYSSTADQSPCRTVNTGRTCGLGLGFVAATRSSDTSCVACDGSSTYSDETGQGACKTISTARTCGAGRGFVAATSVSDTACESCVDGASFSGTVDAQPCISVDDCHLDLEQYESTAPTTSSDRFCSSLRQCSSLDQYVSKPATTTSDRECGYRQCVCTHGAPAHGSTCPTHGATKCLSCDAGFKFVGGQSQPDCGACAQGTFRTMAMKSESCSAFRTQASCPAGTQIDTAWGSAARDHRCTACTDGSFRQANYNGLCQAHSTTSAGKCAANQELDLSTGTAQSDHVCVACDAGNYRSGSMASCALKKCTGCQNGTKATGTTCPMHGGSACSSCDNGYFLKPNKTCQAKKMCSKAQYMSHAGTGTSDRVCSSCVGDTYMSSSAHTSTSCLAKRKCGRGMYAITGTRSTNRTCKQCSLQGSDKYQDASSHTSTTCKERKECGRGEYMSSNGSSQANRVCKACQSGRYRSSPSTHRHTTCSTKRFCGSGTYAQSQGSTTSNRLCAYCTGDTYQSSSRHTRSSCYARRKCGAGQRTISQGSRSSNRACTFCSTGQFQTSTAHTSTSCTAHKTSEDCGVNQETQGDGDRTQDHTCGACDAHHYRTASMSTCAEVQCTCDNGAGASGSDCSAHGDALCTACDDGYDLVGGECKESITPSLSVRLETELSTVKGLQFEIQASATGMFSLMSTTSTRGDKQCDGTATISSAQWSAFKADTSDACTLPNTGSMADRCSFYVDCLDKNIPCGAEGYAQSYGKFYCDKFVRQSYKTSYAATWRDDTLKCLQQELHDALDTTSQQLDTCGALETVAFNSHADCYTQSTASVCDICEHQNGADDLWKIFTAVEMNAYENTKSYKPLFDVLKTCVSKSSTSKVRRCAQNIATFSKNRLLDRGALEYLRGTGPSGIAYKVKNLLRYYSKDELMGTMHRSLKGLINQHWNKKTALQAMAIPGVVANAAVSLTDTLLDGVQDALDSFSEKTEGYCRLGQGTFDVWAGLELGRPDWGIAYTLPNGADVGNCIKKIASNYFCGVIKKAGNTLGNLLDTAHNTYGLSTGIEIGTTPGVLLGCDSNLCLPKLVRAVRSSARDLRSKLSGSGQEKANMLTATKSASMSESESETAVAGMTHSDQGDLMGESGSGWTHELFVKVGAPETEIEFTATVESSSVASFVTAISNELVDVMNDVFLENFNPPSPIDTVWSVMVGGIKKGVRAAMEAQAKACGALSFHATLTLDVTELEESGFELGFTCQKMGGYTAVSGAFPMLNAIDAFSSSQQSQLDTCVAEEGPVEFSFTFAKFWGIADFVPGVNIVADTYVFGLEASFDNWLESMTSDQKALASTCAPPSSQLTIFKMAKALWIKIGEAGLATIEAMIKAIKTIWKVLTDKQDNISNPSGSDMLPSRRLLEGPSGAPSGLVSPRRLQEEIAASSGKICVSSMARIAVGLAESAGKAVKALFDDICSSDDTSMVNTKTTSGSCTIHIKTAEACEDAAKALGMSDTTVVDDGQDGKTYDPAGCYYENNSLKFNSKMTNTGSCSTSDKCLCQKNLCRRPSIKELWRAVKSLLGKAYDAAEALYDGIVTEAGHAFDKLKDMVSDAFNNAKADLVDIVQALYAKLKAKHNAAKSNLIKMFKLLRSAGLSVVQSIKELYNDLITTSKTTLKNLYKAVKDEVGETCELIKDFQEADVPKSSLVGLGSTIASGLCKLQCTSTVTAPAAMPLIGGKDFCTSFKLDVCKEESETASFTYPSCSCDSKEICASIPIPLISDPKLCMDVKMPLTCSCCDEWKTYTPCKTVNLPGKRFDGKYCAPIGVRYCSQLQTSTWGPKKYCSKFW